MNVFFWIMKCYSVPLICSSFCVLQSAFSCCLRRKCVWSGARQLKSPHAGKWSPSCLAEFKRG